MTAAETLAQVANALGLQGVQYSWAGRPQPAPGVGADAAPGQQRPGAPEQGLAAGDGNTAPDSAATVDGQSAGSSSGQAAAKDTLGSGGAAEPATDAAGKTHSTVLQEQQEQTQMQGEPESSEHSEL